MVSFESELLQAVVRQFFENPPVHATTPEGQPLYIPARSTPAQAVAARLLVEKNSELLNAIMESIDVEEFAEKVAANVLTVLLEPENRYYVNSTPGAEARKRLKERVDARLVELLAQDLYSRINNERDAPVEFRTLADPPKETL